MEFQLEQNKKENSHHDHIPFNVKGNGNIVCTVKRIRPLRLSLEWFPVGLLHPKLARELNLEDQLPQIVTAASYR